MAFDFYVPCLFGLEGIAAGELRRLGMKNVAAENGHVLFSGEKDDIARANLNLACGERLLIVIGSFGALSFDELFEGVRALPWGDFIPDGGAFPVKGYCLDSALRSVPDCQSIVKKAVAERLTASYKKRWHPESGDKYQIQFSIVKDMATLFLDTSGEGLHKRGYRRSSGIAPLRETLAAAMVRLAKYRGRGAFADPFCGSGTIAIEAALAAKNRAPGLCAGRAFAAERFSWLAPSSWTDAKQEAMDGEYDGEYDIRGGDIDPNCVELARLNASRAGVSELIRFEQADATRFSPAAGTGVAATNPPYGERIMEKRRAEELYRGFGAAFSALRGWKLLLLSSHTELERAFGGKADKKRKLYNGMIKCDLFMFSEREGKK